MLEEEIKAVKMGFGFGILLMIFWGVFKAVSPDNPGSFIGFLAGYGIFLLTCWNFAKVKGWHGWFGLFLGLTCFGWLILLALPNKNQRGDIAGEELIDLEKAKNAGIITEDEFQTKKTETPDFVGSKPDTFMEPANPNPTPPPDILEEQKKNAMMGFGIGIPLMIVGAVFRAMSPSADLEDNPLPFLIGLAGGLFFLGGCYSFAKVKGWHGWFGLFLGLTGFGWFILLVLPNKRHMQIYNASKNGDLKEVKMLLAGNPDLVFSKDQNGATPLHAAALRAQKNIAELLLANKADVNATNKFGITPLHIAAVNGYTILAEFLLANKADVNAKNSDGDTALKLAVSGGFTDLAELLLPNKNQRVEIVDQNLIDLKKAKDNEIITDEEFQSKKAKILDSIAMSGGTTVAIVSYLTLIGFIIAIGIHSGKKTKLGAFHLRQTLGFFLTVVGVIICSFIFSSIPETRSTNINVKDFLFIFGGLAILALCISMPVLWVFGLVAATNGQMKPMPIIGPIYQKCFGTTFD